MKGGEKAMGPNERRMEIIETLCHRRQDTMANLATEFGVSVRTIKNDIDILSLNHPIETIRGRYGGGVRVMDGYYLHKKYLKPEQVELLQRLSIGLSEDDLKVMNSIFKDFALKS
jgi:predicted DNA-binding transcriptional regulator YafY